MVIHDLSTVRIAFEHHPLEALDRVPSLVVLDLVDVEVCRGKARKARKERRCDEAGLHLHLHRAKEKIGW